MGHQYQTAVYIGRFQPVHRAHLDTIERALDRAAEIIIFIGSAHRVQTIKNPFTFTERRALIRSAIAHRFDDVHVPASHLLAGRPMEAPTLRRVTLLPLRDYLYNDGKWVSEVHARATSEGARATSDTCLIGCFKDDSSYYLEMFPKWSFEQVPLLRGGLSSTDIRTRAFEVAWALRQPARSAGVDRDGALADLVNDAPNQLTGATGQAAETLRPLVRQRETITPDVPAIAAKGLTESVNRPVREAMERWMRPGDGGLHDESTVSHLTAEHAHYRDYRDRWSDAPYPSTFTTVDAVTVKSGCVLLVRRGMHPGKGTWALPGGFLAQDKTVEEGALRELREETSIEGHHDDLAAAVEEMKVYDHPSRSLRGRTITFCHLIDLGRGPLPDITAGSDAEEVRWVPLADVWRMEGEMFEDHGQILADMLSRY